ncbi:TadE family protein [Streptomyces sp. ST2-7A]|uniref:TadE family protein n=1 Tax=Streptomyces sp. ST2-7A TaxID=2907214 RepID=UPI001F284083|nr:TadE family protein [Streptomyces sp. ST2-7A]MCE7082100.1 pilus assembly protein [Streptomyces sp. ST2-7A]
MTPAPAQRPGTPGPAEPPGPTAPGNRPRCAGPPGGPHARRDRQRGVTAVEFAGWLPILLIVAFAGIQLGVAGFAVQQAGSAARAAARVASQEEVGHRWAEAGRAATSDWLSVSLSMGEACGDVATVTASVEVPSVMPFLPSPGTARRTVTMPCD